MHPDAQLVADRLFDGDGGGLSIKGPNLDLWAEPSTTKAGAPTVAVWNGSLNHPIQTYRSKSAFVRDLSRLLKARRCAFMATDASSRVYFRQEA